MSSSQLRLALASATAAGQSGYHNLSSMPTGLQGAPTPNPKSSEEKRGTKKTRIFGCRRLCKYMDGISSVPSGLQGAPTPNPRSSETKMDMKKRKVFGCKRLCKYVEVSDQAGEEEHLHSSPPETDQSLVLGNQTPPDPFLEETMARKKVTAEELQRLNKAREIKKRKNMKKAAEEEEEDGSDEEYDACAICDDGGSVTCCEGVCQRSFHLVDEEHDCREILGITVEQAKRIIDMEEDFICKNCQYKQHQCFACGLLGSSDESSSQPEVFQCEHDDCAHFYHPKCIAELLYPDDEEATYFEIEIAAAREKFTCPMHECVVCKAGENKNDESMQFAVCRRCPTVYHRKCLPSDILFKSGRGRYAPLKRAWEDILPNRILIFCMKHEIERKLKTPARNHIIFPEADELRMPEATEGEPMDQDTAKDKDFGEQPSSSEQSQLPPPVASNQNKCCCSSPLTFAPSSLFMNPYPGSCGWLDDED